MCVRGIGYGSFCDYGIEFLELFWQCGLVVYIIYEIRPLNMNLSVLLLKVALNIHILIN